jgi:hypothetical protein
MNTLTKFVSLFLIFFMPHVLPAADLKDYHPKSAEEKAIIELLQNYEEARNNKDKVKFLSYLHPDGLYMLTVDHAYYSTALIDTVWSEIFMHHRKEALSNPEIIIQGDEAVVNVSVADAMGHTWKATFNLVREKGNWLVYRYTWHEIE